MKISLLIPVRNDADKAIALIKDMYDYVDDIVILDASCARERRKFLVTKKTLKKIRVLQVVALGYGEPLFDYGMRHCRHRWILRLDTDERLNDAMKKDLRRLPRDGIGAYTIKRYEEVHAYGKRTPFFTWQIRLSKRDSTTFKGMIHEQPQIKGKIEKLGDGYSIEHIIEEKGSASKEYEKLELFERFSYKTYNDRMLDYVSKFVTPARRSIRNTFLGRFVYAFMRFYELVTLRKLEREISGFDYFVLYTLRTMAYQIKMHNIVGVLCAAPSEWAHAQKMDERRVRKDGTMMFEISQRVQKVGITKYLGLNKNKTIDALNRKYPYREQGAKLLIKLLKERYSGRYPRGHTYENLPTEHER